MRIFIENITIIDPFSGLVQKSSLLIEKNQIRLMGNQIQKPASLDLLINGNDKVLFPGLIDLHTHLREPGFEYKEDIESGTKAALHGGFTTVTAFPNTNPVLDSVEQIRKLKEIIGLKASVKVLPIASITQGQKGKELVDFNSLIQEGVVAFTDDGKGVQNQEILLEAMRQIKNLNSLLLLHTEDESLIEKGVIHKGIKSKELGIPGIPPEAEETMLLRDIALAKKTGVRAHFCHVSTAFGAQMIACAKKTGIRITSETAPHYLCFTQDMIQDNMDSNKKMNPPLRTQQDKELLIQIFKYGGIDAIATDHAPHSIEEKSKSLLEAPFGIIGLETVIPLLFTYLVQTGKIDFYRIIEGLTLKPAQILGLDFYPIKEGNELNFVIFNMKEKSVLNDRFFYSKSRNFPLFGKELDGKVEYVFYRDRHIKY